MDQASLIAELSKAGLPVLLLGVACWAQWTENKRLREKNENLTERVITIAESAKNQIESSKETLADMMDLIKDLGRAK